VHKEIDELLFVFHVCMFGNTATIATVYVATRCAAAAPSDLVLTSVDSG